MSLMDLVDGLDAQEPTPSTPTTGRQQKTNYASGSFLDLVDGVSEPTQTTGRVSALPEPKSFLRQAGDFAADTGLGLAKGVVGVGQSAVGLANIATGGLAGRGLRAVGYDPEQTNKILGSYQSTETQQALKNVEEAKGFLPTAQAYIENPRAIWQGITESAPGSFGVVAGARGVLGKMAARGAAEAELLKKGALVSGAMEGAQTAGQVQEQAQGQGKGYFESVLPALGAGAGTAAIGIGSSFIPGFRDVEAKLATTIAKGGMVEGGQKGILATGKEIAKDMFKEGVLEEMPQSAQEQIFTNLAMGKPWSEGVAEAAAQGMVVGTAQGGGMSATTAALRRALPEQQPAPQGESLLNLVDRASRSGGTVETLPTQEAGSQAPSEPVLPDINDAAMQRPVTSGFTVGPQATSEAIKAALPQQEEVNEAAMERPTTVGIQAPQIQSLPGVVPGPGTVETEEANNAAMERNITEGLKALPEMPGVPRPETVAGETPAMPIPERPKAKKGEQVIEAPATHEQRYAPEPEPIIGRSERRTRMIEDRVSLFDQQAKTNTDLSRLAKSVFPDIVLPEGKAVKRSDILESIRGAIRTQENYRGPIRQSAQPLLQDINKRDAWGREEDWTQGDPDTRARLMHLVDRGAVQQAVDQDGVMHYGPAAKAMPSYLQVPELEQPMSFKAPEVGQKSVTNQGPSQGEQYMDLEGKVRQRPLPRTERHIDLNGNVQERTTTEPGISFKAPNKPVEPTSLAEAATGIHWSDKPLKTVHGATEKGPARPQGYSQADVQRRMNSSSEYVAPPTQPVAGIPVKQLEKLGKYQPEVFSMYNPKTSKDVFASTKTVPNAVTIENHYDADKDNQKLWAKAHVITNQLSEQGVNYDPHTVFSNLVKQAGYKGYVQKAPIKGETWSVSFDKVSSNPPTTGRVMVSDNVQGASPTPANLRDTLVRSHSEIGKQTAKKATEISKNYPEAKMGKTVMSAYKGGESSNQYENSFDTFIEAPLPTLRAIAVQHGVERNQESVVVQVKPTAENPANGINVAFDFPTGTKADAIEKAMEKAGLGEFRVVSNTNNDKLSVHYFIYGDENANKNFDKFEKVFNELGQPGTLRKGAVYSELIEKGDYEKTLANYHGATRGTDLYRKGQKAGEQHRVAEAKRASTERSGRSGAKQDKGEDLNFKIPTNEAEREAELKILEDMGYDPDDFYRDTYSDEDLDRLERDHGAIVFAGDILAWDADRKKMIYFGSNYARHNFLKQKNPLVWATSLGGMKSIENMMDQEMSTAALITIYPNLLKGMETNDEFQNALIRKLKEAYGDDYVNNVMVPKAEAEHKQRQAKFKAAKEEAQAKLDAKNTKAGKELEKLDAYEVQKIARTTGADRYMGSIAVTKFQPTGKEAKALLKPGQKKVSLQSMAREMADPDLLAKTGHVIGIAHIDKGVRPPAKAGDPDTRVYAGDPHVNRYPVEINGRSLFYLPKAIPLKDLFDFRNARNVEMFKKNAPKFDKPLELRKAHELSKDEWFALKGFPPSSEKGSRDRQNAMFEHIRLIKAAMKSKKTIPLHVLESYEKGSDAFAREYMGMTAHEKTWVSARQMTAFLERKDSPVLQMLLEASYGDMAAWKEFADAKSIQAFSKKWMKDHPELNFKLDRFMEFTEQLLPEAATPMGYRELLEEARDNGWLTPEEWEASNVFKWLENVPDASITRDYLMDYLDFRNEVYKSAAREKADPAKQLFNAVERQMQKQMGAKVEIEAKPIPDKAMNDFVVRFAKLFNKNLYTVNVKGDFQFYGLQRNDDILINIKSKEPHMSVLGHELTHALKQDHPDLYEQLVSAVKLDPGMRSIYMQILNQQYQNTNAANNVTKLEEEMMGNVMGQMFMDSHFWEVLGEYNPSLLEKVYNLLRDIVNKAQAFFRGDVSVKEMMLDYETALDKAAEIMAQYRNRVEFAQEMRGENDGLSFKLADQWAKTWTGVTRTGGFKEATERFQSVNSEAQKRFNEANLGNISRIAKMWDQTKEAFKEATKHFPQLDKAKDAKIAEALYQHEVSSSRSRQRAGRELVNVTKGLTPNQYEVFRYATILPDLQEYVQTHQLEELPFGYASVAEIGEDIRRINSMVSRDQKLKDALDKRKELMTGFRDNMIKSGILPANVMKEDVTKYFHHQVMSYFGAKALGEDFDITTQSDVRQKKYGWMMARKGSAQDFNTNYAQAEFEVLAQGYAQMASMKALKAIKELNQNDAVETYMQQHPNVSRFEALKTLGLSDWQPEKGNYLYKAKTISDRLIEKTLAALDHELNPGQEQRVYERMAALNDKEPNALVLGPKKPAWAIPTNVAKTLNDMVQPTSDPMVGKASAYVMRKWKQYVLMNPLRLLRYNINNMTGDLDIALAYDPAILKGVVRNVRDLYAFAKGNKLADTQRQNNLMRAERKGIINAGLTAVEIQDMDKLGPLRALTMGPRRPIGRYSEATARWSTFRENIMRLRSYEYFQEKVGPDKTRVYGASNKTAIDALYDQAAAMEDGRSKNEAYDDIAAKLARELIGDYGSISQAGQWIRKHAIPFYSWMEVNAPRYVNLLRNAKSEEDMGKFLGPLGRTAAAKFGVLGVKAMLLYGMVAMWNATMFPDEDDEMKRNGRNQLHLILGRTDDGKVRSIRFQGALSDALAWFGLEQPDKDIADLVSGKKSLSKFAKETAIAPVNKVVMGAAPFARTGFEAITGRSLFPDIMRPKPIRDRMEHIARSISLDMPYRYFKGIPSKSMDQDALSTVMSYSEPGEAAYYYSLQKMGDYLEQVHKERPPGEPTDRSNALYYYKKARKLGDHTLAEKWWKQYKEYGGNSKTMLASIKKSDPLAFLPVSERAKFIRTLDQEDRQTLKDARDWWKKTYKGSSMSPSSL